MLARIYDLNIYLIRNEKIQFPVNFGMCDTNYWDFMGIRIMSKYVRQQFY